MSGLLETRSAMVVIGDGASTDLYVIGAEWALCQSKAEAAKRVRGHALALAVESDEGPLVTTLDRAFVDEQPARRPLLNALGLIGAAERNAIVFHELPHGQVWVAAVREGVPLPDCDRVTALEPGHELLGEYMTFVPNSTIIGSVVDAARSVEAVLQAVDPKRRLDFVYKKPKSPMVWVAKVLLGTAVAAGAVVGVQSLRLAQAVAEQAKAAALARMHESARIDALVQQYRHEVQQVVARAREEAAQTVPADAQLSQWLAQVERVGLVRDGFRLESVSCTPAACRFRWRALRGSDLRGPTGTTVLERDDTSVLTAEPLIAPAATARVQEPRLALASRFHQATGLTGVTGLPGLSLQVSAQESPIVAPAPAKPDVPPATQAQLAGIQPITVAYRADVRLTAPIALAREAVQLAGHAVTLETLEMAPFTTATGGAVIPQTQLTGSYVRIP